MRRWCGALAAVIAVALVSTGCSRDISGAAQGDPDRTPVAITEDGYGIRAGSEDAPIQLEIYTEPQCNHCADLQADFGDQLAYYMAVGQLAVTYRPLTFFDDGPEGHSARVANAMFAAATPDVSAGTPSGTVFQRFVEDLWAHQDPGGDGPSADEMAEMARKAGIPDAQADKIAKGKKAVDVADMSDTNYEYLYLIDPISQGTPTIYDFDNDEKLDVYDNDWLSKLMAS